LKTELTVLLSLSCAFFSLAGKATDRELLVEVDRKERRLVVLDPRGKLRLESRVGLGRGGLAGKHNMNDGITPCGKFKVDIVLCCDSRFNAVSRTVADRYKKDRQACAYLNSTEGLSRLFSNMNSLDFNADGRPDNAYGTAYIGLDSPLCLTGPKLSRFSNKTYWFSIAIHGTNNEKANIGKLNSGGCIQVPAAILDRLVRDRILVTGSTVLVK
jgi:hypothetical protein